MKLPVSGVFDRRLWTLALVLAGALVLAQFWLRPPWRDEYWALYFSAIHDPLVQALREKISRDVHPPFYFSLLHFWRQLNDGEIFARSLNLVFLALGAWAGWAMRARRERETALFLLLCGTSFWLVFFSAEIRMMQGLFIACALMTLAVRNALDAPESAPRNIVIFCLLGMVAASSHYFGVLWTAALGLAAGVSRLRRGSVRGFLAYGVASVAALVPILVWTLFARPDQNPGAIPPVEASFATKLFEGLEQFLRGLTTKTMFANLPAAICLFLGLAPALSRKDNEALQVIGGAIVVAVLVAFGIHLFHVPLIKERAFIVIIPGLLYLTAASILSLREDQTKALAIARYVPLAAVLSLPLFSSELFKDRERYSEVRAYLRDLPACAASPMLVYERPQEQAWDFSWFYTESVLKGVYTKAGPNLVRAAEPGALASFQPAEGCPVRVLALNMPKGEERDRAEMTAELTRLGVPVEDYELVSLGKGRSRILIEPD